MLPWIGWAVCRRTARAFDALLQNGAGWAAPLFPRWQPRRSFIVSSSDGVAIGVSLLSLAAPLASDHGTQWQLGGAESIRPTLPVGGRGVRCDGIESWAPVAQLDSASVFGTEGWGFESLRACFIVNRRG
jgi:hypothetical protein